MTALTLEYHGAGYLTLSGEGFTARLDPRLPKRDGARGREVPEDTTYVLVSHLDRVVFVSVLDILAETDAVLVASPDVCRQVLTELPDLPDGRWLDLADFERASSGHFRVTAFEQQSGGALGGLSLDRLEEFTPGPLRGAARGAGRVARDLSSTPMRLLDSLSQLGEAIAAPARAMMPFGFSGGGSQLGFILEIDEGPTVALFGQGLSGSRPDLDLLDDIASFAEPNIVVAAADGDQVAPLVWANRVLTPEITLLYRQTDPYDPDRPRATVPIQRFIEAIEEDSPEVEVDHLRAGDGFVTSPELGGEASTETKEAG